MRTINLVKFEKNKYFFTLIDNISNILNSIFVLKKLTSL